MYNLVQSRGIEMICVVCLFWLLRRLVLDILFVCSFQFLNSLETLEISSHVVASVSLSLIDVCETWMKLFLYFFKKKQQISCAKDKNEHWVWKEIFKHCMEKKLRRWIVTQSSFLSAQLFPFFSESVSFQPISFQRNSQRNQIINCGLQSLA